MAGRRGERDYRPYDDDDDSDDRMDRIGRREPREPRRERERPIGRGDPPREVKKPKAKLNNFFVNGEGIHRDVLQREICRFLGYEAVSNPTTYNVSANAHSQVLSLIHMQGVDGYMIKAVRPFTQVSPAPCD